VSATFSPSISLFQHPVDNLYSGNQEKELKEQEEQKEQEQKEQDQDQELKKQEQ